MSQRKVQLTITEEQAGIRIDKIIAELSDIASRAQAMKIIGEGLVTKNNKALKSSYKAQDGDLIDIVLVDKPKSVGLIPYELKLDILFEDKYLIVLNKPSGLVVHPAHGHQDKTLVNALVHHTDDLSMGFNEMRPGIVHRLDKETSGVMVVAKNNETHTHLAEQFRVKSVHRVYNAITYGPIKKIENTLKVESYLVRHPKDRKKYCSEKTLGDHKGKFAVTHLKKIMDHPSGLTLLECRLETGRTHQIRVHVTELGHPIIGDNVYGNSSRTKGLKSVELRKQILNLNRIGLHAKELGFIHPVTNTELTFSSPWPEDLIEIAKRFSEDS